MSHDIEIVDNVAQFCYVVRPGVPAPWHGLGQASDKPLTWDEAVKLAPMLGASYSLRPMFSTRVTPREDGSRAVAIPFLAAIFRDADETPVGSGSPDYEITPPARIGEIMARALGRPDCIDTAGVLGSGRRMFATGLEDDSYEVRPGDSVQDYLVAATSFDQSKLTLLLRSRTRVVCANTLAVAEAEGSALIAVKHTKGADAKLEAWTKAREAARVERESQLGTWRAWARYQLDRARAARILENVFPGESGRTTNVRNRIGDMFANREMIGSELSTDSAWDLYQAVTQWVDRERPMRAASLGSAGERGRFVGAMLSKEANEIRARASKAISSLVLA